MFHELICLLFACLNIMVCASSSYVNYYTPKSQHTANHIPKTKTQNSLVLQGFYKLPNSSKQIHGRAERSKRGIVLIDEDFNVPPEPGVKQGWSDGNFNTNRDEVATTIFLSEQGSGSSETLGEEPIITKSSRFVTPGNLKLTSFLDHNLTPEVDYSDQEGSGDVSFKYTTESTLEDFDTTSFARVSTSTEAHKDDITVSVSSSTSISASTEIPSKNVHDSNVRFCLNFTCNSKDLIILPSLSATVSENTNLTFSCALSNVTEKGVLSWYKYNETDHSIMEESNIGNEISFSILNTSQYHAGRYMCVRFNEQSCCHRKIDITVYEMPSYRQHFIIIGSIVAASLLVCILLGILKSVKTKKYEEAVELKNLEKPFLL